MQQNKVTILSTGLLPAWLAEEAELNNIKTDIIPFIKTEAIQSIEVQQEIEQALLQAATIVFTSRNAVEAVAAQLEGQDPEWIIYCVGEKTMELAADYFGEDKIYDVADDAASLAGLIVEDDISHEVIFFCGDQRRDELPAILRTNNIDVDEIVVYQTISVPQKLMSHYDGILFYSPSGVESFFEVNKIEKDTTLFAIGNTTSNAIKKYSDNKIIISKIPDKEQLFREVFNYFAV
jgi:uroporphyrinogen-III synthase